MPILITSNTDHCKGYRTLAGTHALHVELEDKIAHFKGTEAAVTFSSAYAANASAVQTILGKEDIVVSDQLNHVRMMLFLEFKRTLHALLAHCRGLN